MIQVLVADDHRLVREGIRRILSDATDMAVEEASTGPETIEKTRAARPHVVLLDVAMPGADGVEVLTRIKREQPDTAVLVLSMYPEDQYAVRMIKAGAAGYLTKDRAPDELIAAIRKVADGGKYITSTVAEALATTLEKGVMRPSHELLSDREFQVLRGIASGKTVSHIATQLGLSVKTVSTYRARLLEKMGLKNNAELTRYAVSQKLVD